MTRRFLSWLWLTVPLIALPALLMAQVTALSGAGATFPYPLYAKWAEAYARESGVKVNYQSIGSGAGIKQARAGTVDFGASDTPLEPQALAEAGLVQFPTVMGGVVPVVNVEGVGPGQLRLTGAVLADLYRGLIKRWDDRRIRALNPDLALPSTPVRVVHRADASGTTWIFTNYLATVSEPWRQEVGNELAVAWPTGVGGKGNEGVAAYVGRLRGGIGYVEYAFAFQNQMAHVRLKNRAGQFVEADSRSFQAAAENAQWQQAPGFYIVLTDQPGEHSWPIVGVTFVLMQRIQGNIERGREVLRFFDWSYRNGDEETLTLHYVPLPDSVEEQVRALWSRELRGRAGEPLWPPS